MELSINFPKTDLTYIRQKVLYHGVGDVERCLVSKTRTGAQQFPQRNTRYEMSWHAEWFLSLILQEIPRIYFNKLYNWNKYAEECRPSYSCDDFVS